MVDVRTKCLLSAIAASNQLVSFDRQLRPKYIFGPFFTSDNGEKLANGLS